MSSTTAPPTGGTVPPSYNVHANEERLELSWRHPKGLWNLSLVNFGLRLITLGIYHFWAKTEVRKRLWSGIRINGEPLTYTGRGLELFLGFLIVAGVVLLPTALLVAGVMIAFGPDSPVYFAVVFALYAVFFFLIGVAVYRAMRYRLARTRWRGIRGSLDGNPMTYGWTYFWTGLLVPLTAGWITPWRSVKLQELMTNNIRFGDRSLKFTAQPGPLYAPFAVMWVGGLFLYFAFFGVIIAIAALKAQSGAPGGAKAPPTPTEIGIIVVAGIIFLLLFMLVSAWYQARLTNHFANNTHFANATFRGNVTAGGLIWLTISNLLILAGGALLVCAVVAIVVLPFIGLDPQQLARVESRSALQVVATLVPLLILLSFGLLMPVVQARALRYVIEHLSIEGTAPLADIIQASGSDVRFGEGLAEAFDVDAI
ncbi:MAG: DUF898 domain-containing protein [Hyphomicrobiaceae bacterium]|nr:DUF898 domain-containing protein [Hyphomicrobiaceae bacterium]